MNFAGFECSWKRGELCRGEELVALQEQPMRLLDLLLEWPGEIISRERMREVLWKHKHGDHERGINTAVRKLRSALGPAGASGLRIATSAGSG